MEDNDKLEKKTKKALKIAKFRPAKNFGWWCLGFFSPLVLTVAAVGVFGAAIPVKVVLRNEENKFVDEAVGNETFLSFILNYKNYSISSFPVVKNLLEDILANSGFGSYVSIDYDKLGDMSLGEFDFNYILNNCLEITATMRSLGLTSSLGAFASLKTLTDSTPVTGEIDTTAANFKPALYYFYNDSHRLIRAFDDQGNRVPDSVGQTLYYPALADVPLLEVMGIFPDRIGMEGVTDLLGVFTSFDSDSMIYKLFEGYSISDLGSFDPNGIALSSVISYGPDTKMLFDVICAAVVSGDPVTPETVTIGDLQHLDIEQVHLVDIMEVTPENQSLFDTLKYATNKGDINEITIGDLYAAQMSDVPLTSMIAYAGNEKLYSILCQATGKSDYASLTIGDMNSFNLNDVYLSAVSSDIPDDLKDVLVAACDVGSFDEVKVSSLNNFQISRIPLSYVIEDTPENSKLISILVQATGASIYAELTVNSLSAFSIDNVLLSTVMPENESLFNILSQATGVAKELLKVSDLTSFSVDSIKLSTVINTSGGNPILDALLNDDTATVGNIGDKLNALTFHSVYGEDCFTLNAGDSFTPGDHYEKVGDEFVYDNDGDYEGDYYVSKTSGMMLLYAWSSSNIDSATGRPGKYSPTSISFSDFNNIDANIITESTIYQLIASGILSDSGYSDNLKKHTLQEVITAASMVLS